MEYFTLAPPWMLLAEVNYLCGVSPGVGERHFSRGLESQLHIKKLSRVSARVPHPLTPRFHNSVQNCLKAVKDIWGILYQEHEIVEFDPALGLNETPQLLLYWERRRLQDSCVDTFHLSHWSENRPALAKQQKTAFQAASYSWLKTPDVPRFLSCAFLIEITGLWFIETVI